jgi:hypothetical protein
MANLSPTAIRIRNADERDPSGFATDRIFDSLVIQHGYERAGEIWDQALNELDDANGVEREA